MRCERDWGYRQGVRVRCVRSEPHDVLACEVQTATQAAEEGLRAALGVDGATIGIRWAGEKIVRILINGSPIGPRDWNICFAIGLPVVPWIGGPTDAWLISRGKAFRCYECKGVVAAEKGAGDNMPEACDECLLAKHKKYCASTIPSAVIERMVRAADEAVKQHPGACVDDLVRHAAEILGFGIMDEPMATNDPDEQHGATLSAHCGTRPWDDMSNVSRRLWIERAKRLRKRWAVDEMVKRLNTDIDGCLALRRELCAETEWSDKMTTVQQAAAIAIGRLRRERDDARAQRRVLSTGIGRLVEAVNSEPEWFEEVDGESTLDVAIRVIRRLRSERAGGVLSAARNLVASWEQNGLSGIASSVYDLRAALEKAK